jgi:hypothetical protein
LITFVTNSFEDTTNESLKLEIGKRIMKCVEDSYKMRSDPIPGSSLHFSKSTLDDADEYKKVLETMNIECFVVCSNYKFLFL